MIFERYFGARLFSPKQLLTIPLYTLAVSCIYIAVWVFHNSNGDIGAIFSPFSPIMRQALHYYFHEAIFLALVFALLSISLTRIAIHAGKHRGSLSFTFASLFFLTISTPF